MKKKSFFTIIFIIISIITVFSVTASETDADPLFYSFFDSAAMNFSKADYGEALDGFQKALAFAPENKKGEIYFRTGQCHMALGNYTEAEKIFNHVIMNYPDSSGYHESYYQKGRIHFISGQYEKSIETMNIFLEKAGKNILAGSAFYWIGESLFNLGHRDKALQFYTIVTEKYKNSYKYEASKFMAELIRLSEREDELVKLLKWSHEEALKERENFIRKEKEYNQAILAYQKKLSEFSDEDVNTSLKTMQESNNTLKNQLEIQNRVIDRLMDEIKALKADALSDNVENESKQNSENINN